MENIETRQGEIEEKKEASKIVPVICSGCQNVMGEKEVAASSMDISHTICDDCVVKLYGPDMAAALFKKRDAKREADKSENKG